MDQSTTDMGDETEQPKDEENDDDGVEHVDYPDYDVDFSNICPRPIDLRVFYPSGRKNRSWVQSERCRGSDNSAQTPTIIPWKP
jgi:hypothetical protein